MAVTIRKVETKADLKRFARLNYQLYKDNAYAVPDLLEDILDTFNPKKNAAYDFCEAELFLALRGDEVVGRVACIVNHRANETWHTRNARFGWIDFIDDEEVSTALIHTAQDWGRKKGCDKLVGPLGFTDMDPEGMLIDGFDQLSTMSTIYNYPYYPQHMERLGLTHEIDWVERKVTVPYEGHEANQDRYFRVAELVKKRFKLHIHKFKNAREIIKGRYQYPIFDIINKSYAELFGYSEMTRHQIDKYTEQYLRFLDTRLVSVVETEEGEIIAVGITMASLSHAIQKAKGRLFPFGWWHMLKAMKWQRSDIVDMLLVGVTPEWQSKGVNALLFADLIPTYQAMGFKTAETHPQLETNNKSQDQWAYLDCVIHKRRRCYQVAL